MKLQAEKRAGGKPNALRAQGRLPGIVYNRGLNVPISVDTKSFDRIFRSQGTSHVIDLDVDGETHEVLVKSVQMDKRRRVPMHVDFYAVTAGQEVEVAVRIDFVGTPLGAREGGQIDIQRREIEILILPRLIPDNLEVQIGHLEIGDAIHIADVRHLLPSEATVLDDEERTLITVLPPRVIEEEVEEDLDETLEPEVIGRGDDEEDDADAEEDEE